MLGVSPRTLEKYSAVSAQTAEEMALGAREQLESDIAISITGEAGPYPDPLTKQNVGTVFVGISTKKKTYAVKLKISPQRDREYIRRVATSRAMREIISIISQNKR